MLPGSPGFLTRAAGGPCEAGGWDVLTPRRIFILPSRLGAVFALVLIAMLFGAVNYGNSLAYALAFLLGSMAVVSTLHTYRNLRRLEFRGGQTPPIFQGEPARFTVSVANPGPTPRFAVSVSNMEDDEAVIDLSAGEIAGVRLARRTPRRGWLRSGRLTVSSRYPLGLFRAWAYVDTGQRCLVYPAPAQESLASLHRGDGHADAGAAEGSEEFGGLRRYRAGDSLRHVHWKAWAGGRGLLTKQFEGSGGQERWLRYRELPTEDTEHRLSLLCRMLIDAEESGDRYGLELPGQTLGPGRGPAHLGECLKSLALFEGEGQ